VNKELGYCPSCGQNNKELVDNEICVECYEKYKNQEFTIIRDERSR
jgi:protein-arginine kinase activator protein McsA